MKKMKRLVAVLLAAVMVLAMLTACGGPQDTEIEKAVKAAYLAKLNEAFKTTLENDGTVEKMASEFLKKNPGEEIASDNVMQVKYNEDKTAITEVLICYDAKQLSNGVYKKLSYEAANAGDLTADVSSVAGLLLTKGFVDLAAKGEVTAIGVATNVDQATGKTYVAIGYTYTFEKAE